MAASDTVLLDRDGDIATVTLNNPDKLNALNLATFNRLREVVSELDADDSLRCVVFRGAGDKAFASGADISAFERERADIEQARAYGEQVNATMTALQECRHPTLALIKGVCVGGGLELACVLDMRICGESSRFGVPIKNLGLTVAYDELRGLMALTGPAGALEILLEGRVFGAGDALRLGLVNRVVPDERVEEEVYAAARRIADGAPLAARWHKKFVRRLLDPRPLTPEEIEEGYASLGTEDYRAGVRAFLAKEKPRFRGR
jgi:enoyl-CoA hydratase